MKQLSVIIVSYKNIEIVRNCLDSIQRFNDIGEGLEVILSDNSPDDALVQSIRREYPWVKTVKNENRGFGAGNNRGYELSEGEYLLFLNPDTILTEPVFAFAVEQFKADERLAEFGVQLTKKDGRDNPSFFVMDHYGIISTVFEKISRKTGRFNAENMYITGADIFIRRSSFEQAGRFDENLFMYFEEADLTRRIKLYSEAKVIRFFKNKKIIHLEGGTEEDTEEQYVVRMTRITQSNLYYAEKFGLDFKRMIREKRRYQKFKLLACKLLGKKQLGAKVKRLIAVYDGFIK